jgi:AraC-like DNA-binding protein
MPVSLLGRGPITAYDYRCDAPLGSKAVPEQHRSMSISYVRSGSFGYHVRGKAYELVAGSILIGCAQHDFTCTHEYVSGDVCLSFQLAPELAEEIGEAQFWRTGVLPPLADVAIYGELACAAADGRSSVGLEEAALLLAGRAARASTGKADSSHVPARDRKRAVQAAEWIDERCAQHVDLAAAARAVSLSPFYFLRTFTRVLGVTPHQYLVRSRLRRAVRLFAASRASVTDAAFECGFGDLSNFTRTFSRAAGVPPATFRNFCKAPAGAAR